MHIEYHKFYSSNLKRDMEFKSYGHAGKPMIVFPSSGGSFYEYEDFGMIRAISKYIDQGKIRVYTPSSIDRETWLNSAGQPYGRAAWHNMYDLYIVDEFIPFVRHHSGWFEKMMTSGCSMGAFHAVNFLLKHPDVFDYTIALSGIYNVRFFVGNRELDYNCYINSPIDYLANMQDSYYLDQYKDCQIIICVGQGSWEEESIREQRDLERVFKQKGIKAWFDYWGYDVAHDWPWWRKQIDYYLQELIKQGKL